MPDPVAEKSGFLRMYMASHPDTLVAYAQWFGKVTEPVASAEMTRIDSKSMTLTCTTKTGTKKQVHILIRPPLRGYEDVKPRLLEMKAIAQENLGMIKAPVITSFRLSSDVIPPGLGLCALIFLFLAPRDGTSPVYAPARLVESVLGPQAAFYALLTMVLIHILESLYTLTLCRRHRTGFLTGTAYVLSTIVFGLPIWRDLRKRVQLARIESVMKVE